MMPTSTTASLKVVDSSYSNTDLIDIAVYYRIHSSEGEGEERAKTSFDESHISSGRINALSITPPHTAGSSKHASQKSKASPCRVIYSTRKWNSSRVRVPCHKRHRCHINFQGDIYPGSDEGNPVAIVNATTNTAANQRAKPTQENFS